MPSVSPSPPTIIPLTCKPVFLKGKQSIDSKTRIELRCATVGATIYYSINGRQPDPFEKWQLNNFVWRYTAPFTLSGGKLCTVKAIAVDERLKSKSAVVSKTFHVTILRDSSRVKKDVHLGTNAEKNLGNCTDDGNEQYGATQEHLCNTPTVLQNNDLIYPLVPGPIEVAEKNTVVEIVKVVNCLGDETVGVVANPVGSTEFSDVANDATEAESPKSTSKEVKGGCKEMVVVVPSSGDVDECVTRDEELLLKPVVQVVTVDDSALNDSFLCDKVTESADAFTQTDEELEVHLDDKSIQATSGTLEQSSQTEEQNPDPPLPETVTALPQRVSIETHSVAIGTDLKLNSTSCQTHKPDEKILAEQGVQTEQDLIGSNRKGGGHFVKASPGRGYWRQQIDHISTQLKTEAYNNLEFQELIAEPCLAQINNVKVHEGLDELVLVISMAIQRPRINQ